MRAMTVFISATLCLATGCAVVGQSVPDPEKPGPFPVGVTTTVFVDCSRTDATTNGHRTLPTEIWYPATDDAKNLPKNKLSDFFFKANDPAIAAALMLAFQADLNQLENTYKNRAVRDARVRDGVFPLLLFSHGNGGLRCQNAFWCEHMASHGYIVVSPDHTGNCAVTCIDGNLVFFNKSAREQSGADRPKDIQFLIDMMERVNKGGDSRFQGKIDLEHIGVAGHSYGGYTSTLVADADPRVDAIAPMAGVAKTRTVYDRPVLILVATEDDTIGREGNEQVRRYFDESTGPRYLVEFKNAGHYSFTEMYQFKPDFGDGVGAGKRITNGEPLNYAPMDFMHRYTNGYTAAFFGKFLKGLDGYEPYLKANPAPEELIVK